MSVRYIGLVAMLTLLLSGCGTMNTNFSCNATAGDSCLTIEQVDAMTRFADDVKPRRASKSMLKAENNNAASNGAIAKMDNGQAVWIARQTKDQPWG